MKLFKKAKKGFTLVELVVVIAVIAILAAVSVGAYFGVTESANRSKLEQEAKQAWTTVRLASLAGESHSTLDSSGLHVYSEDGFRNKVNFVSGMNYTVDTTLPDPLSGKAIILSTDDLNKTIDTNAVYKTFSYFTDELSSMCCKVDVLSGETTIVGGNFNTGGAETDPSVITGIVLEPSTLSMVKGSTNFLNYKILPATAGNATVVWSSTNENIVRVDQRGLLTAEGVGEAVIKASVTQDENTFEATSTVTVTESVATSITLDRNAISFTQNSNEVVILNTIILPESAADSTVTWSVEPQGIVNVSNGSVTVVPDAVGVATITASVSTGVNTIISDTCEVEVLSTTILPQYVQLSTHNITFDSKTAAEQALNANVYPTNATAGSYTIEYSGYDSNIISYDSTTNKVTPKEVGVTEVIATLKIGNEVISTDTCRVEVLSTDVLPQYVQFDKNSLTFIAQETEAQVLEARVYPENTNVDYVLDIISSDEDVVTYNPTTKKVSAIGVGETQITATLKYNNETIWSDVCEVTVHQGVDSLEVLVNNVSGVSTINLDSYNDVTSSNGRVNSATLLPILKPYNATNKEAIVWTITDPNNAINFDENSGLLTSTNNFGEATIKASANGFENVIAVNVTKHITDIGVNDRVVDFDIEAIYNIEATLEPETSSFDTTDIVYSVKSGNSVEIISGN